MASTVMKQSYFTFQNYYCAQNEGLAIFSETKNGSQINDKNTVKPNRIFEAILQGETDRLCMRGRTSIHPP